MKETQGQTIARLRRQLKSAEAEAQSYRNRVWNAKKETERRSISTWTGMSDRFVAEIDTLGRAEYIVEIKATEKGLVTSAVRRENA